MLDQSLMDARMKKVFADLPELLGSSYSLTNYFLAAWGALADFDAFREERKHIDSLVKEISSLANALAELLEQSDSKIAMRKDVTSIRNLLEASASRDPTWSSGLSKLLISGVYIDASETKKEVPADFFWSKAPSLSVCLRTLSVAATDVAQNIPTNIEKAVESRVGHPVNQYLRSFGCLLAGYGIRCSKRLAENVATTTEVILSTNEVLDVRNTYGTIKPMFDEQS